MTRAIIFSLCITALMGIVLFAGHAWAAPQQQAAPAPGAGALLVSVDPPRQDPALPGLYRAEHVDRDAVTQAGAAASAADHPRAGILLTGFVRPIVTIVSPEPGTVSEIVINTDERDAGSLHFAVRRSIEPDADAVDLDEDTWRAARVALAAADAGAGTVWRRDD